MGGSSVSPEGPVPQEAWVNYEEPSATNADKVIQVPGVRMMHIYK